MKPDSEMENDQPCSELNEKVLLCYTEKKDWRACQKEVLEFKECFVKSKQLEKL